MLNFRPHLRTDALWRVKWLNNRKAAIFAIDNPNHFTDESEQQQWFDNYEKNPNKKFFTICDNQKPIGFMGLSSIDLEKRTGNIFIMIGEDDYRRKGLGKISLNYLVNHAFNEMGLEILTSEVAKLNLAGIKLVESLNFKETGESEKEFFYSLMKN